MMVSPVGEVLGIALMLLTAVVVGFVAVYLDKNVSRTLKGAIFAGTMVWICTMEGMSLFSYIGVLSLLPLSTSDLLLNYILFESMGLLFAFTIAGAVSHAIILQSRQQNRESRFV